MLLDLSDLSNLLIVRFVKFKSPRILSERSHVADPFPLIRGGGKGSGHRYYTLWSGPLPIELPVLAFTRVSELV